MAPTNDSHDFRKMAILRINGGCHLQSVYQAKVAFEHKNVLSHRIGFGHSMSIWQQDGAQRLTGQTQWHLSDQSNFRPPTHGAGSAHDGQWNGSITQQQLAFVERLGLSYGAGHFTAKFQVDVTGYLHLVEYIRHENEGWYEANLGDHLFQVTVEEKELVGRRWTLDKTDWVRNRMKKMNGFDRIIYFYDIIRSKNLENKRSARISF